MNMSRRLFCTSAAVGTAGAMLPPRRVMSPPVTESGLATGKPVPLPYESLPGFLGAEQLRWHHESHYAGALKGFLALDVDPRGSHRPRIEKANSAILHEYYFANMTTAKTSPGEATTKAIADRFGGVAGWRDDFVAAATSARGWALLAWHPISRKLYNVVTDAHDDGPPWLGVPLVVVDTYEHSYYLDFQNRRADYVEAFADHIAWNVVEERLRSCTA